MDLMFLGIVAFLLIFAIFNLFVGVSNDAVNFLNSALGSKAAPFKTILMVCAIGVLFGASMSSGMMDIARHGIFHPEHFTFFSIICIYMAVMVTNIILLDAFNSLGLPTSTTVSMVFELLGATFAVSSIKMHADATVLGFSDLLNTDKALQMIIGIFLSVAIAFVFGIIVQWLTRLIFSFRYKEKMKWKVGIFGGIAATAILYFMLLKGAGNLTMMTPEVKSWISQHNVYIITGCLIVCTCLMHILNVLKINVFKVIVLLGTFSLAMAFAGNDLVNFIGVPLGGLEAYTDYAASGVGDAEGYLMSSLNSPANTPVLYLIGAGIIMVFSLAVSEKARNVSKTEVGLGGQNGADEMFGSSRIARHLVRNALTLFTFVSEHFPKRIRQWVNNRFNTEEIELEEGASFDLVRASVNLVLAALLIALGTSLKLPLSTTFVTFMVAMGSSLADRAWGRESAVFRITGVISVIGGWFITAGAAFVGAALVAYAMYFGGHFVIVAISVIALVVLIRSNMKYSHKTSNDEDNKCYETMLSIEDKTEVWNLLREFIFKQQCQFISFVSISFKQICKGFAEDNAKPLYMANRQLVRQKDELKMIRRKETLCLRRTDKATSIENGTWFHMSNNASMSMLYNLRHIGEICLEHVDNNFNTLPDHYATNLKRLQGNVMAVLAQSQNAIEDDDSEKINEVRNVCNVMKDDTSRECREIYTTLRETKSDNLSVIYVYLNLIQETQEMLSSLRKLLRAVYKMKVSI